MEPLLILDSSDTNWKLFGNIIKIFITRKTIKIISRCGIKPLGKAVIILKIILFSLFFFKRDSLFLTIDEIPEVNEIYRFFSEFDPDQFV